MRDFAANQNSDNYLASETIKRETSAKNKEARARMRKMSEVYQQDSDSYVKNGES